jgi:outer membrane immunogenic protein
MAETAFDGFYVGGVIGAQLNTSGMAETLGTPGFLGLPATIAPRELSLGGAGIQGGLVTGYNFSSGSLVYGVEADLIFGDIDGEDSFSGAGIPGLAPDGLTTSASRSLGTRGSFRARLGTTVGESALLYVTGGAAVANASGAASVVVNGAPGVNWAGAVDQTRWGWTVGAGAEFKISSAIALRGEYLYTGLGTQTVTALGNATVRSVPALNGIDYVVGLPYSGGALRAGVLFRF